MEDLKDKAFSVVGDLKDGPPSGAEQLKEAKEWIYYKLDLYLAQRINQFKLLVFSMCVANISISIPWYFSGGLFGHKVGDTTMVECMWECWATLMDTGTQFYAVFYKTRVVGACTTIVGVIFAATLTGFVVDAVMEKMNDLRKGKSAVKEWNHTLLIGWTDRSIAFISQICLANESDGGGTIVVLAERDKEEMETELASTLSEADLLGSQVVFRQGSPLSAFDLRRAACETARSIVIMASGENQSSADAATLRVVIALKTFPKLSGHVVAEVLDKEMEYLLKIVGGEELETMVTFETLARMSLNAIKQPGVAVAYESLLGFEGDEFYTNTWPCLAGKTFGDCVEHFVDAVAIGVKEPDGTVIIKPSVDYVIRGDTGIIVVAEDDDSYEALVTPVQVSKGYLPPPIEAELRRDRILFVGWTDNVRNMLSILNSIFDTGAEVHLLNRTPTEQRIERMAAQGLVNAETQLPNLSIKHIEGDPATWRTLRALDLPSYACMLVISDEFQLHDLMASDSHNLACILLLRHHHELNAIEKMKIDADESGNKTDLMKTVNAVKKLRVKEQPIFCEILDTRTQKLIASHPTLGKSCNFLVSNRLISKILAMVAEDRTVVTILNTLLSGFINIGLRPSSDYIEDAERVNFYVAAKRAQLKDHVLIGYQARKNHEDIYINPKDKDIRKNWKPYDFVVIFSEEAVKKKPKKHRLAKGDHGLEPETPLSGETPMTGDAFVKGDALQRSIFGPGKQSTLAKAVTIDPSAIQKMDQTVGGAMGFLLTMVAESLAHAANGGKAKSDKPPCLDIQFKPGQPMGFVVGDKPGTAPPPVAPSAPGLPPPPPPPPRVSGVTPAGQAAAAGVKEGWKVLSVSGRAVATPAEMVSALQEARRHATARPSAAQAPAPILIRFEVTAEAGARSLGEAQLRAIKDDALRERALQSRISYLETQVNEAREEAAKKAAAATAQAEAAAHSTQSQLAGGSKPKPGKGKEDLLLLERGFRSQETETTQAAMQERQLRGVTERLLKETEEGLAGANALHENNTRVLDEARRVRETQQKFTEQSEVQQARLRAQIYQRAKDGSHAAAEAGAGTGFADAPLPSITEAGPGFQGGYSKVAEESRLSRVGLQSARKPGSILRRAGAGLGAGLGGDPERDRQGRGAANGAAETNPLRTGDDWGPGVPHFPPGGGGGGTQARPKSGYRVLTNERGTMDFI